MPRFEFSKPLTQDGQTAPNARNAMPMVMALACVCGVFITAIIANPNANIEIFALIFLTIPALAMSIRDSRYLIPYILVVWAIAPEVRRISDWMQDAYQPMSMIGLAPLVATSTLFFPITKRPMHLTNATRKAAFGIAVALIYGGLIGIFRNGWAAAYDFANWLVPMFLILYSFARPSSTREREMWVWSLIVIATGVALYGWIQFLVAPPWDTFWMRSLADKLVSIGLPHPLELRVFSTLNAPALTATFLAAALCPMLVDKRFRAGFGWLAMPIIASAALITFVRAIWVMIPVFILVHALFSDRERRWRTVLGFVLIGGVLFAAVPILPGGERIVQRVETVQNISKDHSYNQRASFITDILPALATNPVGYGTGFIGVGSKLNSSGGGSQFMDFDNGILATLMTFGIFGGCAYFGGLFMIWKSVRRTMKTVPALNDNCRLALAALAFLGSSLIFTNSIPTVGGLIAWLFVATAMPSPPRRSMAVIRDLRRDELAPSENAGSNVQPV